MLCFLGTNSPHNTFRDPSRPTVHTGVSCDSCHQQVVGLRHHSLSWPNFDLCDHCVHTEAAISAEPFTTSGVPAVLSSQYNLSPSGNSTTAVSFVFPCQRHLIFWPSCLANVVSQFERFPHRCSRCKKVNAVGVVYKACKRGELCCQACYLSLPKGQRSLYKHVLDPLPGGQGTNPHNHLIDWVWKYFSDKSCPFSDSTRVVCTGKPPLYFQHEGHSRTIVGIEKTPKGFSLLVLDPGISGDKLEGSLR